MRLVVFAGVPEVDHALEEPDLWPVSVRFEPGLPAGPCLDFSIGWWFAPAEQVDVWLPLWRGSRGVLLEPAFVRPGSHGAKALLEMGPMCCHPAVLAMLALHQEERRSRVGLA